MNSTPLDNQSGAADDSQTVRIVRLETQMDHVTSALISLQRTQEQNHLAMLAQFEAMHRKIDGVRDHVDGVRDSLNDKIGGVRDSLNDKIGGVRDGLNDKIDGVRDGLSDKIDSVRDSVSDKIDKSNWELLRRMDRQLYWLIGLFVTNMTITVGALVRLASI